MILDYSSVNFDFNSLIATNNFEEDIIEFLKTWFNESDEITVQTSGSTGIPKQIVLTKNNMRKSARMTGKYLKLKIGDTAVLAMPVNYIAGKLMIVRAIELGLKLICLEPRSTIEWNLFSYNYSSLDFVALTPMQVEKSLEFVSHCKKVIIGGAALSDKVKLDLINMDNEIYETYAMTETITHIAFKKVQNAKFTSVNPYFEAFEEVKIGQDERNCLVIQTPYDGLEVVTNDIVELIDERNFSWIGRADNVINSGGIKLFPEQIEERLKHIIPSDFYITSEKDQILGEKVILVVEGEEMKIDLDSAKLSRYQLPKEILFIPLFERTESGKIKRKQF